MANKSNKTYNSYNKKSINKKNSSNSSSVNKKNYRTHNKQKKDNDDLDVTTRIRIDENRINDADSLDVSFLEGKSKKINNSKKEKILNDRRKIFFNFTILRVLLFGVAFLCIIILFILIIKNNNIKFNFLDSYEDQVSVKKDEKKDVDNVSKNDEKKLDDNYLFVGDYYTEKLDFDDYDFHYVKVCDKNLTVDDLLKNMKSKIYDFNPSIVFLQVGINDLNNKVSEDDLLSQIYDIIKGIKENRPYAKIYIESLYPINPDISEFDKEFFNEEINNNLISNFNVKLKKLTDENDVEYINLFDLLINDDNKLDEEYYDNGIDLNDSGYEIVLKEINKIEDDEV